MTREILELLDMKFAKVIEEDEIEPKKRNLGKCFLIGAAEGAIDSFVITGAIVSVLGLVTLLTKKK